MPLRHDYEKAGSACIDYSGETRRCRCKRVGIVAISLGGYYAPRCASLEPVAACVAWARSGIMTARGRSASMPASRHRCRFRPSHHVDSRRRFARRRAEKLERPGSTAWCSRCAARSVVHGEDDEQIPLKDAQALYDASGPADKTLRVFTAEEGGAQHCSATTFRSAPPPCGIGSRTNCPRLASGAFLEAASARVKFRARVPSRRPAYGAALDLPAGGGAGELPAVGHHAADVIAARSAVIGNFNRFAGFIGAEDLQVRRDDGPVAVQRDVR